MNMKFLSKSAKRELEKLRQADMRVKDPIQYVEEYEFKGLRLGDVISVKSDKLVVEVKVIGFQLDTKSDKFIAVKFLENIPKAFKDVYYGMAKDNKYVDVVLNGEGDSHLLWCSSKEIIKD